jgi:signal transduction histidine kinase
MTPARTPSIRSRLANALLLWSVLWGTGVALAVGFAAQREVDELLDETLQSTAAVLSRQLVAGAPVGGPDAARAEGGDFAWQVVDATGSMQGHSANAPPRPLFATARPGLSESAGWRVFGLALGQDGRMLYVAHRLSERNEAHTEVALSAVLAALSIGLLGHVWLRARVRHELQPLERLSERLAQIDPLDRTHTLGAAERAELSPVHDAIDALGRRLAQRVTLERAFSAHAAHALRTPLAGMDAQLAVAQRECPPDLQPRLARVREASNRLQRVVRALLDLFRASGEARRSAIDLPVLVSHLPIEGLEVEVQARHALTGDADLLAAALANLLDNARRHGARNALVSTLPANALRLVDDGPGVAPDRRQALRTALASQSYDTPVGLGLMLADLVARSHGGLLRLPDAAGGFAVELSLG